MRASIVICTHNRAAMLEHCLEAALAQACALDAEVLVVDNASSDETAAVLAARHDPALRVLHEPVLGLSRARNCGLEAARGEVAVFLDDDAVPRPGWLAPLLAPYATAGVTCVGGRIVPRFPAEPPAWVTPALYPALGAYDLGDEPCRIGDRPGVQYPYGGNISFRVDDVRALGGFSIRMGLRGRRGLQQEETDLCYRLDRAGGEVRYVPDAVVDHLVSPERLRPQWFLARHWRHGQSNAMFELKNRGLHRALGLLRWHYQPFLKFPRYALREPVDGALLAAECQRREAFGYLVGLGRGVLQLPVLWREQRAWT